MPTKDGGKSGGRVKGSKNKKIVKQEFALEVMREKIRAEWDELISAKLGLAKGVWTEKKLNGVEGAVKVYKDKPDGDSLEYLFSMVAGRPKEALDINLTTKAKKLEDIQNKITKIADNITRKAKENA
jgi:hypothetical protein